MKRFDIHYKYGDSTMSYEIKAKSWEEAEKVIPPGHWVYGEIIGYMDEGTGVFIQTGGEILN